MNLKQIEYVHCISKFGSMHKAAKELYISQPNLTKSISSLENELGITIFNRNNKGVELTQDGYDFLINTKPILIQMDHIEKLYKNFPISKHFKISCQRFEFMLDSFITLEKKIYKFRHKVFI